VADDRSPRRPFTLSSAPGDPVPSITTRMTGSRFKQRLQGLADENGTVEVSDPRGCFCLDPRPRPTVMIAGGIGITPFRSMIREASGRRFDRPVVLVHSNTRVSDIAFRDELDLAAAEEPHLRVVHTITGEDDPNWPGRRGRIDAGLLRAVVQDLEKPLYYICGPPAMVDDVRALILETYGIRNGDVRSESFRGY
jgi:ferredoxin-NADP reductase